MKRIPQKVLLLLLATYGLTACEKSELTQDSTETVQKEANSMLQVRTRTTSTDGATTVSYPVNVYVFSGNKCVSLQTISEETQTLSIPLVEGRYVVYAIGGATAENYILPSKENATAAMIIALREGKSHTDLMVAQSSMVLVDGGINVLTLSMERKVMLLQNVVLKKIPTAATAVSVTLSPLWTKLEGTSYNVETGTETITLTKQEDGRTWSFSGSCYLLPPAGTDATITINIVEPTGTTSYTYNTSEQLEAGDILNIQGTYTEAVGVTLTGTIEGAIWNEEKTISFDFNEHGSQTSPSETGDTPSTPTDYILVDNIPEAGDTYQGCYVLSVTANNGVSEVLLLSSKQKVIGFTGDEEAAQVMSKIETAMPDCSVSGIDGWRLMTKAEAQIMNVVPAGSIPEKKSNNRYLFIDGETVKATYMKGSFSPGVKLNSTDILRPVAIVKMKKQ